MIKTFIKTDNDTATIGEIQMLQKKALRLEYFTVGYNLLEAIVAIGFGVAAVSMALVGFGMDSIVESLSGVILIWRLTKNRLLSPEEIEIKDRRATKLVASTFFILGTYVLYNAAHHLLTDKIPDTSLPGIVLAIISLIVMPVLAVKKNRVGIAINSRALIADSRETWACAWLSGTLLLGLGSYYLFGWWQIDPITAMVISLFLFKEGWENWNVKHDE